MHPIDTDLPRAFDDWRIGELDEHGHLGVLPDFDDGRVITYSSDNRVKDKSLNRHDWDIKGAGYQCGTFRVQSNRGSNVS